MHDARADPPWLSIKIEKSDPKAEIQTSARYLEVIDIHFSRPFLAPPIHHLNNPSIVFAPTGENINKKIVGWRPHKLPILWISELLNRQVLACHHNLRHSSFPQLVSKNSALRVASSLRMGKSYARNSLAKRKGPVANDDRPTLDGRP
jgi:hypothetical protein